MNAFDPKTVALALLLATVAWRCDAESLVASTSSAASSASSAGSASLRGSSDSIRGSSDSSTDRRAAVADGEYRIARMTPVDGMPQIARLTLVPAGGDAADFRLDLPTRALAARRLSVGDLVRAQHRPYGIEFAHADTREPFFLVLDDGWERDLRTRVVAQ